MKRVKLIAVLLAALAAACPGPVGAEDAASTVTVVINEIEINPAGRDAGAEWVELLNIGETPIDLAGWQLTASYRAPRTVLISEGPRLLAPGERFVFTYPSLSLRNDDPTVIQLLDASGNVIDQTPAARDRVNDELTWQRYPDGGDSLFPDLWLFGKGTRDKPNQ